MSQLVRCLCLDSDTPQHTKSRLHYMYLSHTTQAAHIIQHPPMVTLGKSSPQGVLTLNCSTTSVLDANKENTPTILQPCTNLLSAKPPAEQLHACTANSNYKLPSNFCFANSNYKLPSNLGTANSNYKLSSDLCTANSKYS